MLLSVGCTSTECQRFVAHHLLRSWRRETTFWWADSEQYQTAIEAPNVQVFSRKKIVLLPVHVFEGELRLRLQGHEPRPSPC